MDLAEIASRGRFARAITAAIRDYRPMRLLETGTHLGTGSTAVIADAMGADARLITIESNPEFAKTAAENLSAWTSRVEVVNGLSIPRWMLPGADAIESSVVCAIDANVAVDYPEADAPAMYLEESGAADIPDDAMGDAIRSMGGIDFVLLDSAGHLGYFEFNHLLSLLSGTCLIALDDVNHIKHWRSAQRIICDRRFDLIEKGNERFGYLLARYNPQ